MDAGFRTASCGRRLLARTTRCASNVFQTVRDAAVHALGSFQTEKMPKVAPPPPRRGSSQGDASSAQPESSSLVLVSEDPACREICGGVVAPSDDPVSDGRWCPDENPVSNASSAGEAAESSEDVVIVGCSRGTLQRRSQLENFTVTVKVEKPWDSGYLASEVPQRDSLQATTGTPCQGTSKGAETTSSGNERAVKTKPKACSVVLTCTRIPKVPRPKTPNKASGQGRQPAAKDGAAGREKKTAADSAVTPFEPAAVKKLKSIKSALETPMPRPKPDAAAATKSKPRGRKKQETVLAGGTKIRRRSAGAEATTRNSSSKKTAVRRAKNGETPAPSCKVPTQVQSTYELRRRSMRYERDLEAAVAASIAEAAAVQAAGKRSESNDDPPGDGVNASQGNTVPAADKAPRGASTSERDFLPHGLNSSLEASADVVERRTERLPQGASTAAPHGSSMDLRPVLMQEEGSVSFEYSTLRGVTSFSDGAAGFEAMLPPAAAPDLEGSADEGVVNTEASASAPLESASPESCPVESSDARTCNEAALPTKPQRSAATSTQSECIKDSHGTQRGSSVPVEASSRGEGTVAEAIAREPSDNVTTTEEATSATVYAMESTTETHSLSSPGAFAPLESASPESCPVESSDARTFNEAALFTKPQRSAATSTQSECIKDSHGTQRDSSVPVEASSRDEGTAAEVIVREPSDNVRTTEEATSAAVEAMESTGDTHSLSAPDDHRDEMEIPGTSTDASAEENEGNSVVRDAGAQEPVCSRENSSRKRRRTDDDVALESEPIPAVVESVQRECADCGKALEMSEGPVPLRYMTDNMGGRQDVPQGSRSPDVPASSTFLGSLSRRTKVRIIAQSDFSTEDIQPSTETDVQILLPRAGMSEHCHSSQGLQANTRLCSGHLPENVSLSEPTCSQDTPNNDDCIITHVARTRPQPEWSEVGGMGPPQLAALATGQQLLTEPYQSGSTGYICTICHRPPDELVLEMLGALCRCHHASAHAQANASLAATEAAITAPDDQPRLVPPAHPSNDTMRDSSSALRRQPAAADDDLIVEVCELSRGGRHLEDGVASGRSLCHCRRARSSASQARATARGPRDATSGGATTTANSLGDIRALRRAALFEMNSMRALHVLQLCRDERTRRMVLQLYNEGRNSLAMEAYAAEIHALVRSAVDRARLDSSALAGFLQDLSNAEWLLPETPRRSASGPQLRNMRDLS